MRRFVILLAILAMLGLANMGSAQASTVTARTTTTCTSGTVKTRLQTAQPGDAEAWFSTASSPSGCAAICPEAQEAGTSQDFWGGRVTSVNFHTVAQITNPSPGLGKAWVWKLINGSWLRERVYPTKGIWEKVTGTPLC